MDNLSGRDIKGYEIREQIGKGGLGAVYRAYQPVVDREVAIKVILPQYANRPEFIRRFEVEAQLVARLEHPFIVPLYDYWRDPDGAYLVMRYLRGGSLRGLLQEQGPLTVDRVSHFLDQIAAALTTAHRSSVIHRDLKPDNILLDEEGNAYLSDFGIAKSLDTDSRLTPEEGIMGSPNYLAPEQARGEPVTPQTDIYSLGIVLYELLTGEPPFQETNWLELLNKHLHESVPHLGQRVPEALNVVIQRATAKNPSDRYPNVIVLAEEFRKAIPGAGTLTQQPAAAPSTKSPDNTFIALYPPGSDMPPAMTEMLDGTILPIDLEHTTWVSMALPDITSPYKGLRPFQEADTIDFFGREKLTERLIKRLTEKGISSRFLAVLGPSGSGKSSLVKAGLLPRIRQGALPGSDQWFIVEMIPGPNPFEELEAALLRVAAHKPTGLLRQLRADRYGLLRAINRAIPLDNQTEVLLVIDQFEELFTLVEDEAARAHFIASLLTALAESRGHLRVIVTLRADFYDRPLQYSTLGELIRQRNEVVLPLTSSGLERAIVEPAVRVGLSLEPGLAAAIIKDVAEQPGTLPLLQYALTELFERREGRTLTLQAYRESGGVFGALASRADELYNSLHAEDQTTARQMFLRLVTLGESTEDTRRRVRQSELATIANTQSLEHILDLYGRFRLLTFDRDPATRSPTVEVAHEALLRSWGRLRDWIESNREDMIIHRRLSLAEQEWTNANQDPSFLATGARLEQFRAWAEHTDLSMNKTEATYLQASTKYLEVRRVRDEERKAREHELQQQAKTRLQFVIGLVLSLIVAFALVVFALVQERQAQEARTLAVEGQNLANTQSVALERTAFQLETAQQQLAEVPNYIATLAALPELEEVLSSLQQAIAAEQAWRSGEAGLAAGLAVNANRLEQPPPMAQRILAEIGYGPIIRYAAEPITDRLPAQSGGGSTVLGLSSAPMVKAVSPDGGIVLLSNGELVDAISGVTFHQLTEGNSSYGLYAIPTPRPTSPISLASFSPDGHTLATGRENGEVALWHVTSGGLIWRDIGHRALITALSFSPDGRVIVSGASDASLLIWNEANGEIISQFQGHQTSVRSVAVSANDHIISSTISEGIVVWDMSGTIVQILDVPDSEVNALAVSPDGSTALSGQMDGSVIIWNLERGSRISRTAAHQAPVHALAVDANGGTALSAAEDGSLVLWNLSTGDIISRYQVPLADRANVVISADLKTPAGRFSAASLGEERLVTLRYVDTATIAQLADYDTSVTLVILSADGRTALSGTLDGQLTAWDMSRTAVIHDFGSHDRLTHVAALSPNGRYALTGTRDQRVVLWDTTTGAELWQSTRYAEAVTHVAFSPDGRETLTIAHGYRTPIQWSLLESESGAVMAEGSIQTLVERAAILHEGDPGEWVVMAGIEDGSLLTWRLHQGSLIPGRQMPGHPTGVRNITVCPDGDQVLTQGQDGTMRVWHLPTGELVGELTGFIGGTCLTGENQLYLRDDDEVWWVGDITTGNVVHRLPELYGSVSALATSRDGRTTLVGLADGRLIQWHIHSLEQLVSLVENDYPDLVPTLSSLEVGQWLGATSAANPQRLQTQMYGDLRQVGSWATAEARAISLTATAALRDSLSELTRIPRTQTQMAVDGLQRITFTPTSSSTPTLTPTATSSPSPTTTPTPVLVSPTPEPQR